MKISLPVRLIATIAFASLAGCSNKSAPNEENFAAAISEKLASSPEQCLPSASWPASAEPSDHGNPYAFYDAGMGFVKAGLVSVKEQGPNASTNFRKKVVFSLTDDGRKALVRDSYQPYPNQDTGHFCYGKAKLNKVVKWTEPATWGGVTGTTVYYSYEMTDVPKWAQSELLRAAYASLANDMSGTAQATMPLMLTNRGWQAAN